MPRSIAKDEVRKLLELGARLVAVLSRAEHEEAHWPGAINVPLKVLNRETTAQLRQ